LIQLIGIFFKTRYQVYHWVSLTNWPHWHICKTPEKISKIKVRRRNVLFRIFIALFVVISDSKHQKVVILLKSIYLYLILSLSLCIYIYIYIYIYMCVYFFSSSFLFSFNTQTALHKPHYKFPLGYLCQNDFLAFFVRLSKILLLLFFFFFF
jgi:hypothetical protein